MKISLAYPKIPNNTKFLFKRCVAFKKYDGSNLHFVWCKKGFNSFGTRRDRFPFSEEGIKDFQNNHPELKEAPDLLDSNGALDEYLFSKFNMYEEVIVFAEFFGANSFAGSHDPNDKKELVIFDIMIDGKLLSPEDFIKEFKFFNIAEVIYQGKYNGHLINDIRQGRYSVNEGAVIKGVLKDQVHMVKVKTDAYMDKLKNNFKDKWKDYWE